MNPIIVIGYYIGIALLFALLAFVGELIFTFPARTQNRIPTFSFKFGAVAALFVTFFRFELLSGQKFDFWILALPISTIIVGEFLGLILQALLGYSIRETAENMAAVDRVYDTDRGYGMFKSIADSKSQTVGVYWITTMITKMLSSSGIMILPLIAYFAFKNTPDFNSILFFSFLGVYLFIVLRGVVRDFGSLYLSPELKLEYKAYRLVNDFRHSVQISAKLILFNSIYNIAIGKAIEVNNYILVLPIAIFVITAILPYLIGVKVTKYQIEKNINKLTGYISEIKSAITTTDESSKNRQLEKISKNINEDFEDTIRRSEYNNRYMIQYGKATATIEFKDKVEKPKNYFFRLLLSENLLLEKATLRVDSVFPNVKYCQQLATIKTKIDESPSELSDSLTQNWISNLEKQKSENESQKIPVSPLVTSIFTGASGYIIKLFDDKLLKIFHDLIK